MDDPESVAVLKEIHAKLKFDADGFVEYVDISERDDITDEKFKCFSGLPRLKEIHAIYTPISGTGLKHLNKSLRLEVLDLYGCAISDDALSSIKGLTKIRHLNLIGSKVTDDSIEQLSGLTKLEYLGISSTQITDDGRRELSKRLPEECEID